MRSLRTALLLLLGAAGCFDGGGRMAMGDVNSIIVVADSALWSEVRDTVLTTLQPRIFAVRQEPTFLVTHVTPTSRDWGQLRRFRQILAIGGPEDPWVRAVLEEADTTVTAPAIVQATEVWARNQVGSALVVPSDAPAEAVRAQIADLAALIDRGYRRWARQRMYTSGVDTALADTVRREGGFTVYVPNVYTFRREDPNGFLFFNDQLAGTPLVRSLFVSWTDGIEGEPTPAAALAWRDSVGSTVYDWRQRSQREPLQVRTIEEPGEGGLSMRGIWTGTAEDGFPQAGPFITRVVDCPASNRRYLLDAWLYAPAADKYQYMIQLETLLGTFECA